MKKNMRKHLKILGCLFVARSVLILVIGFIMKKFIMHDSDLSLIIMSIIGIIALGDVISGYGLITKQAWSKKLGLLMSFLGLCSFPIGTALGIYGMWTLFDEDTTILLNKKEE